MNKETINRAILMLRVAAQHVDMYATDETTFYDGTDCDGNCIAEDRRTAAEMLEVETTLTDSNGVSK